MDVYEIHPAKAKAASNRISDALPFGRLWYEEAPDAVEYAKFIKSNNPVTF